VLNYSKFLESVLGVLKTEGYINQYKILDKKPSKKIIVYLSGKINECRAIKPRFAVNHSDFEKFEKSFLISRDVGSILVSTTKGLMTHRNAKKENLGGRLIAYVY
jgi:small subunit ribosomal protein S8